MNNLVSICISNKLELLESTVDYLLSILDKTDLTYKKKYKLRLATEEIISNRIINAYKTEGKIYIDLSVDTDKIEISVRDLGEPYLADYNKFNKNQITQEADGLESFIIMNSVDYYGIEKLGKDGQRSFIQMALPSPINFNKVNDNVCEILDKNFKGRTILDTDEEVLEAIKCIYSAYEYSYAYENLYYPDKFKQYINDGILTSIIAINESNQVAGHVALSCCKQYARYPEVATMMVKNEFRGLNISEILIKQAIIEGKKRNYDGLRARPAASHPISQKLCLREGFVATGFLFHYVNPEGMGNCAACSEKLIGERLDLAVCSLPLNRNKKHYIYPPKKHKEFINSLYKKLEIDYEQLDDESVLDDNEEVNFNINKSTEISQIIVDKANYNTADAIKNYVYLSRENNVQMIELFINLNKRMCSNIFIQAEKSGFIFSGIETSVMGHDYLIMQHLMGHKLNFNNTVAYGDFKNVLNYLKEEYNK